GPIERGVGHPQQVVAGWRLVAVLGGADAEADRDRGGEIADLSPEPIGQCGRDLERSVRKDDHELVAADPAEHVGCPQPSVSTAATCSSTRSPPRWPWVSLTSLK